MFVIALGKAAGPMLEILLERMKRRKGLRGICASNQLPTKRNWRFRYFESGHPLPNEDSFAAARAALALLRKARKDTLVFFLISGGGSALFELPLDPHITLEDTIEFNQLLLASGAPINEINTLRKHFSAVKGGRLAMAAPEAAKVSLLLPDVPLRALDALASGPTSPDHSTVADARELLAKYHLAEKLPASIRSFFERADFPESPGNKTWRSTFLPHKMPWADAAPPRPMTSAANMSEEDEAFRDSVFEVLLSSHDLVESARTLARNAGYHVVVDNACDDWDYADAARYLLERFHTYRAQASALLPDLCGRSHRDAQSHARRGRPQSAVCSSLRPRSRQISRRSISPCSAPAPTASTAIRRPPEPSPTLPPWLAPAPLASIPSSRWPSSMPARSSPPSATPWSPDPPATTCATCAC